MAVMPCSCPIMIIGVTDAKVTPCIMGMREPTFQKPTVWRIVAMPQVNKSALIK